MVPTYDGERVAMFVDGANIYGSLVQSKIILDFSKFDNMVHKKAHLLRKYYYTCVSDTNPDLYRMLDWMSYNNWTVVTRAARTYYNEDGKEQVKGNADLLMAADLMELGIGGRIDHAVLLTGDGDFSACVRALKRHGIRVTVVSTPRFTSDELKREADHWLDLEKLTMLHRK